MGRMRVDSRLREDFVPRRRRQRNQVAVMKTGEIRTRSQRSGVTATMSFTAPVEIDQIIDRWANEWNMSRSAVIRQAILRADLHWRREA